VALREFIDERGNHWQVCDVNPGYIERRSGADRRSRSRRAGMPERRVRRQPRMVVAPRFRTGWLVFESNGDRRRLGPIPPGWEFASERDLRGLLYSAEQLRPMEP